MATLKGKNPFDDEIAALNIPHPAKSASEPVTAPLSSLDAILPLSRLSDDGKHALIEILTGLRGMKALVLEPQLGGLLNLVLGDGKMLKENGVTFVRELKIDNAMIYQPSSDLNTGILLREIPDNLIFIIRPHLPVVRVVARHIQLFLRAGARCQFHIYFIPHRTVVCEQILEDEGVLQHVEIGEYHLNFIPFESDLLSLELDTVFRQCYVDGDTSPLNVIARALCRFQDSYGIIPHVKSKGAASKKVVQKMFHMRREEDVLSHKGIDYASSDATNHDHQVDSLIILDREVDMVSALVTPLTYEGLIDEIIGIENNRIKVDASIAGEEKDDNGQSMAPPSSNIIHSASTSSKSNVSGNAASSSAPSRVTVILDNNDLMYGEIRNQSIERLGVILQEKAIKIRELYSNFRENKDASLSEIHDFVKKIPHLTKEFKYLQRHINIAGFLKSFTDSREFRDKWQGERGILEGEPYLDAIEEMICADVDRVQMFRALRLLCLQSLTAGGVRTARYETIKRLIIQNYGYEELFTLINLERAGILKKKDLVLVDGPSVWQGIRKQLKLIDDETTVEGFSYVAAGYSPLLVRLVQYLGRPSGWSSIVETMRLLPGPLIEVTQSAISEELHDAMNRRSANNQQGDYNIDIENDSLSSKRTMLVVVIGGLTFLEIAAFRYLSKDPSFPYRIIMATTKLVNGNTLLRSLSHNFDAIGWSKTNQT